MRIIKIEHNDNWFEYQIEGDTWEARLFRKGDDPIFADDGSLIMLPQNYDSAWIKD